MEDMFTFCWHYAYDNNTLRYGEICQRLEVICNCPLYNNNISMLLSWIRLVMKLHHTTQCITVYIPSIQKSDISIIILLVLRVSNLMHVKIYIIFVHVQLCYVQPDICILHMSKHDLCKPCPTYRIPSPTFMRSLWSFRLLCWPSQPLWPPTAARWSTAAHQLPKWWVDAKLVLSWRFSEQQVSLIMPKYINHTRERGLIKPVKYSQQSKPNSVWNHQENYIRPDKNENLL